MKVLIAGTRGIEPTFEQLGAGLELLGIRVDGVSAFVSGLCPNSPDMLPHRFVAFYNYNIPIEEYPADWTLGRWAGVARNKTMAEVADVGIVFWNRKSKGSENMLGHLLGKKPVVEVVYSQELLTKKKPRVRNGINYRRKVQEYAFKYRGMVLHKPNGEKHELGFN